VPVRPLRSSFHLTELFDASPSHGGNGARVRGRGSASRTGGRRADARTLVEKAVKAHGGQAALDKFAGTTVKFKGTFHGQGDGVPMTGAVTTEGADKQRIEIEVEAGGQTIPILIVLAATRGGRRSPRS
jgi:hypothetical protein